MDDFMMSSVERLALLPGQGFVVEFEIAWLLPDGSDDLYCHVADEWMGHR